VSDPLGIPPTLEAHCEAPPPPLLLLLLLEQAYEAAATALSAMMVNVLMLMLMLIDRFLRLSRDNSVDETPAEAPRRSILSDTPRSYWQVSSL